MKRFIASLTATTLLLISPGPTATQALAQAFNSSASGSAQSTAPGNPTRSPALIRTPSAIGNLSLSLNRNIQVAALGGPSLAQASFALGLPPSIEPSVMTSRVSVALSAAAFSAQQHALPVEGPDASGIAAQAGSENLRGAALRTEGRDFRKKVAALAQNSQPLVESIAKPGASDASLHRGGELLAELLGAFASPTKSATRDFVAFPRGMGSLNALSQPASSAVSAPHDSASTPPKPVRAARSIPAALRRIFISGTLSLTIAVLSVMGLAGPAKAQFVRPQPGPQAPAPPQPAERLPMPRAPREKAPISASVEVSPQDVTIGHTMRLSLTLRNDSDKPLVVPALKAAIQKALPEALELEGNVGKEELRLEPGESRTVVFDFLPMDAPLNPRDIHAGAIAVVQLKGVSVVIPAPKGGLETELTLPEALFRIRSVLDETWKTPQGRPNFRDIYEIQRGEDSTLSWVAGGILGLLLLIAAERLLAARRAYKRVLAKRKTVTARALEAIASLESEGASLPTPQFYDRFWKIFSEFLMDYRDLRDRVRSGPELIEDISASGKYAPEAVAAAQKLYDAIKAHHFGGDEASAEVRTHHLEELKSLVQLVQPKEEAEGGNQALMGAALIAGAFTGLGFGHPAALLLVVPLAAYVLWKVISPLIWKPAPSGSSVAISSTATLPQAKSWKQRLMWIPGALGVVTLLAALFAIASPEYGVEYKLTKQKTVDSYLQSDVSGSMGAQVQDEDGGQTTALQASLAAQRDFAIIQRRGTTNRISIGEFADVTYTYVRLSNDYDAVIAVTREQELHGSTAIGEAILTGVRHFLHANAYDLVYNQKDRDPRLLETIRFFRQKKFSEGLKYLRQYPDLLEKVLQPTHTKIIVLFSDGGHNTGLHPLPPNQPNASEIARDLGVRVYAVGINTSGNDEQMLKDIARITGARYYRVGDAKGMREALEHINSLEKAEIEVKTRSVKDFQLELILLAFAALGLQVVLSSTKLKTLSGVILLLAVPFAAPPGNLPVAQPAAQVMAQPEARAPKGIADIIIRREMPKSLEKANALYSEGRYVEAIKAYATALEEHPEIFEIYFNVANAYLRLGDFDHAQRNYQTYIGLMAELEKKAASAEERGHAIEQQAMALYNQGNMALMQRDLEKTIDFYKKALRTLRTSPTARWDDKNDLHNRIPWNLEVIQRLRDESDGQGQGRPRPGQGQGQGQQGQGQGQQGQGDNQGNNQGDQQGGNPQGNQPGGQTQGSGERLRQGLDALEQGSQQSEQAAENARRQATPRRADPSAWGIAALPLASIGFTLAHPGMLWLLALLPVFAALMLISVLKDLRAAQKINQRQAPTSLTSWKGFWSWIGRTTFILLAAAGLGVAASQPHGGQVEKLLSMGGREVIPVLDVSTSMEAAEDHRMDHAEAALASVGSRMDGTDRYGLLVFRAKARTASPLSTEPANFVFKVDGARYEGDGLPHGSNIAEAIKHAITKTIGSAKKIGDRKRILILMSDGDIPKEQREALNAAIDMARKAQPPVTIYTLGFGNPQGTKMVVQTLDGQGTEYVIDKQTGKPGLTKLNAEVLQDIANRTGGKYFPAGDGSALEQIWLEIARLEQGGEPEIILVPHPLAPYFLSLTVLFLMLCRFLPKHPMLTPEHNSLSGVALGPPGPVLPSDQGAK